jgi:hypothetical protein
VSEETWNYSGYSIAESPAAGQPAEPFTYVFRVSQGGAILCRYTVRTDAASVKAHWPDIDPARAGDIDAMWAALSSEGYIRVRQMIDSGSLSDKTLTLRGGEAVES